LLLFDEPDADLDEAGEKALVNAIATLRARRATVIIISHRPALIRPLDKLLVLQAGQVRQFGPMEEFQSPRPAAVRMVR
jgi:ABC-type protease/lipase transport system fused ATPase/permease subunit